MYVCMLHTHVQVYTSVLYHMRVYYWGCNVARFHFTYTCMYAE